MRDAAGSSTRAVSGAIGEVMDIMSSTPMSWQMNGIRFQTCGYIGAEKVPFDRERLASVALGMMKGLTQDRRTSAWVDIFCQMPMRVIQSMQTRKADAGSPGVEEMYLKSVRAYKVCADAAFARVLLWHLAGIGTSSQTNATRYEREGFMLSDVSATLPAGLDSRLLRVGAAHDIMAPWAHAIFTQPDYAQLGVGQGPMYRYCMHGKAVDFLAVIKADGSGGGKGGGGKGGEKKGGGGATGFVKVRNA